MLAPLFWLTLSAAPPPTPAIDPAAHAAIAHDEAARMVSDALVKYAFEGGKPERLRAILALGRVGDAAAVERLARLASDADPEVQRRVFEALALAAGAPAQAALLAAVPRDDAAREAWLFALGRVGDAAAEPHLLQALAHGQSAIRARAALALGGLGHRGIEWSAAVRPRLVALVADAAVDVRYAVAYALMREAQSKNDLAANAALRKLIADADAEVRAMALRALGARQARDFVVAAGVALEGALADRDWRVRVEAVRAMTQAPAPPQAQQLHEQLARWLIREWLAMAEQTDALASPRVHPLLEGTIKLQPFAKEKAVGVFFDTLSTAAHAALLNRAKPEGVALALGLLSCQAAAGRVRKGAPLAEVLGCGGAGDDEPTVLAKQLAASLVGQGYGAPAERASTLSALFDDDSPLVRGAAASAVAAQGDARGQKVVTAALADASWVVVALTSDALVEKAKAAAEVWAAKAKAAKEAALAKGKEPPAAKPAPEPFARAINEALVKRVKALDALPVEGRLSVLDAAAASRWSKAASACRELMAQGPPAVRARARACAGASEGAAPASLPVGAPPPVDVSAILQKKPRLKVQTTKGVFVVQLDPALAPWQSAAVIDFAKKGAYNGLTWHRVVPDFVVQGGDPTGSGSGGPGYLLPTEASKEPFTRGAVGIADGGKDTGGTQLFIMHARAPHLEGRYSLVGRVVSGMEAVDALLVGDKIANVMVE